ncbi:unnamed protein product, partial [Prorocentrum cordatum]
ASSPGACRGAPDARGRGGAPGAAPRRLRAGRAAGQRSRTLVAGRQRQMPLGSSKSCSSLHGPSLEPDALAAPGDDPGRELSDDEAQLVCVRAHSGAHSVRVVFYTSEGERAFILDSIEAMMWMSDTHQALVRWTRSFEDTGLRPGMYPFSFFVDGARLLSREHPVYGDTNFGGRGGGRAGGPQREEKRGAFDLRCGPRSVPEPSCGLFVQQLRLAGSFQPPLLSCTSA